MNSETVHRLPPIRLSAPWLWAGVLAVESLALLTYFTLTPASVTSVRYVLYPFVWMNLGGYAIWRATPTEPPDWARHLADFAGVGYFVVLAFLGGLLAVYGPNHAHTHVHGWQYTMSAPGYGPRVAYVGSWFHVYVVPYKVIGYVSLSYLLAAAIRDSVGRARALSGVLGLVTCVGCAFPVLTSLSAGLSGTAAGLAATATAFPMDVSTAAFVLAVAALSWRPGGDG